MPGVFVSGTDTGVGKTRVGCALVHALRARGIQVGVMKPVETGVGEAGPLDALALARAANRADTLADISPLRFALPAAPSVAAEAEGRTIDIGQLVNDFRSLEQGCEWMMVEGAGGLRVPIAPGCDMIDLAKRIALPILLVARASLGTINHTLLSLDAIEERGLPLAGVVISHPGGPISPPDRANLAALIEALGDRLLGVLPPLAEGQDPPEDWIDLEGLLAKIPPR
jgi:dethiobiotin synthetase